MARERTEPRLLRCVVAFTTPERLVRTGERVAANDPIINRAPAHYFVEDDATTAEESSAP